MTAAMNGPEYVTRGEFLAAEVEHRREVSDLGDVIRNFVEDQKRFVAQQRTFLANQELRDKELRRQVRGLQREDADLRDSVRDLEGEAAKAEMIRMKGEMDRKDSLIRSLKDDKKETRGWVVWAIRAALVAGGAFLGDVLRHLFLR